MIRALIVTMLCATPAIGRADALDDIAYVDGCWSYWSVDWGYKLCFHREPDKWVGRLAVAGNFTSHERVSYEITRGPHGLVWTSHSTDTHSGFLHPRTAPGATPDTLRFAWTTGADVLQRYELPP